VGDRKGSLEDVVMFGGVFSSRRVFVSGHTGFKGSWLTLWLLDLGADVTGYALEPPTDPSLFECLDLAALAGRRFTDVRGDVRDAAALSQTLRDARPEIVMHLAAQPMVRHSYAEPHATYETNVMGTVNVLESVRELAAADAGPRVVVNVTSDKCYENLEVRRAYVEGDALGGYDPYSSSKACSELVTAAYRRSFFEAVGQTAVASARAGNVLGGGDWGEDRILPDCIRALTGGEPVEVRSPGAVRPWQHVLEPLSGYLCLAAALWKGRLHAEDSASAATGAWNFGPGADCLVPVAKIVDAVVREWGAGEWRVDERAGAPHEAGLLVLDAGKAERELGWRPAWDVGEAVAATVRWYKEWAAGAGSERLGVLCREDIAAYVGAATRAGASWVPAGALT
jgi:CDP-glucose 4,6-dehydratase